MLNEKKFRKFGASKNDEYWRKMSLKRPPAPTFFQLLQDRDYRTKAPKPLDTRYILL
jgi:hypothetical protein